MTKRVAVIGDATTTGGQIITSSARSDFSNQGVALLGDIATCPKCKKGKGPIIEAAQNFDLDGIPVAYDGCCIACGCPMGSNRIVASLSYLFIEPSSGYKASTLSEVTEEEKSKIRLDAQRLLNCADELCEKHLYYEENKEAFRQEIKLFADDIVHQVDTNSMSYERGAKLFAKEIANLIDQSVEWILRGLAIFGGVGMIMAGFALCSTGYGCIIGAPLMLHGANGIYEAAVESYNDLANTFDGGERSTDVVGPLREIYKQSAAALGMSETVGTVAYDLIDIFISIRGKLKLVPKINEYGMQVRKLWYYGRQDMERYYKQMASKLLTLELVGDAKLLEKILEKAEDVGDAKVLEKTLEKAEDVGDAKVLEKIFEKAEDIVASFFLDKKTEQVYMAVKEPEKVINVKDIVLDCSLVIIIGRPDGDNPITYYCDGSDGKKYIKYADGSITERNEQ